MQWWCKYTLQCWEVPHSFTIILYKNNCTKFFIVGGFVKVLYKRNVIFFWLFTGASGMATVRDFHCDEQNADTDYTLENDELFPSLVWETLQTLKTRCFSEFIQQDTGNFKSSRILEKPNEFMKINIDCHYYCYICCYWVITVNNNFSISFIIN